MAVSARNQIKGQVTNIQGGKATSFVTIQADGLQLASALTNNAAHQLKLKLNDQVTAIVKSAEVILAKGAIGQTNARNRLSGQVGSVQKDAAMGFVAVTRTPTAPSFAIRCPFILAALTLVIVTISSCGKKPAASLPPTPPDFREALQYVQRAALAYEQDATIQKQNGAGLRISISGPLSSGIKAYVELDDAKRVQWIVVRGTSNLINIRSDVDYNKVVESRLQIPLHKGFADAALQVYQFAKPLLKTDYETRVTGHSYGGAAAVIVLMLLKEDGFKLGQAMTFGQPKVTNREGVRKYRTLPLLRFVNAKDPVPLLPPFELFAVLDEGPYQHFGPEIVLEDGPNYRFYAEHQAESLSVLSFWDNLKNLSIQDVPEHMLSTYLTRIRQKVPATSPAADARPSNDDLFAALLSPRHSSDLSRLVGFGPNDCARFVLKPTTLHPIPAYSSQSSGCGETLRELLASGSRLI